MSLKFMHIHLFSIFSLPRLCWIPKFSTLFPSRSMHRVVFLLLSSLSIYCPGLQPSFCEWSTELSGRPLARGKWCLCWCLTCHWSAMRRRIWTHWGALSWRPLLDSECDFNPYLLICVIVFYPNLVFNGWRISPPPDQLSVDGGVLPLIFLPRIIHVISYWGGLVTYDFPNPMRSWQFYILLHYRGDDLISMDGGVAYLYLHGELGGVYFSRSILFAYSRDSTRCDIDGTFFYCKEFNYP